MPKPTRATEPAAMPAPTAIANSTTCQAFPLQASSFARRSSAARSCGGSSGSRRWSWTVVLRLIPRSRACRAEPARARSRSPRAPQAFGAGRAPQAIRGRSLVRMVVMVLVVVDVLEVDLRVTHRVPGLPGDAQDHERDHEADHRVGDVQSERDDGRASDHAETDEAVDARVLAVRDQRGTLQPVASAEPDLCGDLVAEEADHACGGE